MQENPDDRDAEARVNAVKGLILVCKALTQARECSDVCQQEDRMSVCQLIKNEVMPSLFQALDDYSVDNRGDVGSWVREAAMEGLGECTFILCLMDSTTTSCKVHIRYLPTTEASDPRALEWRHQVAPSVAANL